MKPCIQLADANRFRFEREVGYRWFCSCGVHHALGRTPSEAYWRWDQQRYATMDRFSSFRREPFK